MMKNFIRFILEKGSILLCIVSSIYFLLNINNTFYKDCGIIISKSTDEIIIKHGTRTDLYLNIQFEKSGFKSVDCDPTLYFQKKKGDDICLKLKKKFSFSQEMFLIFGFVSTVGFGIYIIILLLKWLYL